MTKIALFSTTAAMTLLIASTAVAQPQRARRAHDGQEARQTARQEARQTARQEARQSARQEARQSARQEARQSARQVRREAPRAIQRPEAQAQARRAHQAPQATTQTQRQRATAQIAARQLQAEEQRHSRRMTRLIQIRAMAQRLSDAQSMAQANQLIARETRRHQRQLERINSQS